MKSSKLEAEPKVYPVGSIVIGLPENAVGVWKRMDGHENLYLGTGLDYRNVDGVKTAYFERVA